MSEHSPNAEAADASEATGTRESTAGREVLVPLSLYKVVVVFSTLFSIGGVVAGFMVLDAATRRASAPAAEIDPLLAILGLGLIAAGAATYAFAGRFRAPGMGTTKPEDSEGSSNDG